MIPSNSIELASVSSFNSVVSMSRKGFGAPIQPSKPCRRTSHSSRPLTRRLNSSVGRHRDSDEYFFLSRRQMKIPLQYLDKAVSFAASLQPGYQVRKCCIIHKRHPLRLLFQRVNPRTIVTRHELPIKCLRRETIYASYSGRVSMSLYVHRYPLNPAAEHRVPADASGAAELSCYTASASFSNESIILSTVSKKSSTSRSNV